MLNLSSVTLICLTGKDFPAHDYAIQKSTEKINFGGVKVVYDYKIRNIEDWNRRVIFDLYKYVDTEFAILIHPDGYIIRPELWNPDWLNYDYIGAPWPLPKDDYSYRDVDGDIVRVGNSVSLRSKKIMELPSQLNLPWISYYGNTNEDGFLCCHNKHLLEEAGCVFAPLEVAVHFSKEHEIPENKGLNTFAFHSL